MKDVVAGLLERLRAESKDKLLGSVQDFLANGYEHTSSSQEGVQYIVRVAEQFRVPVPASAAAALMEDWEAWINRGGLSAGMMAQDAFTVKLVKKHLFPRMKLGKERTMENEAALRAKVIKLAHENPELRQHLVPLLRKEAASKTAMEFDTPEALKKYLHEHPDADKSKHTVKKQNGVTKAEPPKYKPQHSYDEDRMGNITVTFGNGDDAYLQGDDAEHFLSEMRKLDKAWKGKKKVGPYSSYEEHLDHILDQYNTK